MTGKVAIPGIDRSNSFIILISHFHFRVIRKIKYFLILLP